MVSVKNILVDGGYSGDTFVQAIKEIINAEVEVAKRNELHKFVVLPKRWIVERSFAWLEKCRRVWKNCERKINSSMNFAVLAFIKLLINRLWTASYEDVQANFHNIIEFREFGRMMLVMNYSNLYERMLGMIKDTAETRYLKLMKKHTDIFQNVPLKIIASYLWVTDSSLSRIRKEISQKWFLAKWQV